MSDKATLFSDPVFIASVTKRVAEIRELDVAIGRSDDYYDRVAMRARQHDYEWRLGRAVVDFFVAQEVNRG